MADTELRLEPLQGRWRDYPRHPWDGFGEPGRHWQAVVQAAAGSGVRAFHSLCGLCRLYWRQPGGTLCSGCFFRWLNRNVTLMEAKDGN